MTKVTPFCLKDAPSLIEKAWPTTKISYETQKERKAGSGQTLTGLGSYWKGRKPLILTRAAVLGMLLPATEKPERDIAIFEKLMGFDDDGLRRRLPAKQQHMVGAASYEEIVLAARRPEEIAESVLLDGIWDEVNSHLGTDASSMGELVEQLGIMRFGRRPKLADTFSGSGSIPFEAARMGCDVYASDLNPIACMLTWGAFNIVGASPEEHARMKAEQERIVAEVDAEITALGIEHDSIGNRAKVYLYCLETRCPRTGYMVPMAPSWVISKKRNIIAKLVANTAEKRYEIEIHSGVSAEEMKKAEKGTVIKGVLHHPMLNDPLGVKISEIRGDHKDEEGNNRNRLRLWEKSDFRPREGDIWQERLYAIQWMDGEDLKSGKANPRTWFAAPTAEDMDREQLVNDIVEQNLLKWQEDGLVPDMRIEHGQETTRLMRERGWTHWHHLFNGRHLVLHGMLSKLIGMSAWGVTGIASLANRNAKTAMWGSNVETITHTFSNQAINTLLSYASRGLKCSVDSIISGQSINAQNLSNFRQVYQVPASETKEVSDIYLTDPPYADAVQYDEITEYFIAWLRKNPPTEFADWVWDSRRALAIKGEGQDFKLGMIEAYKAMTKHMSDNGMQIIQFTHQGGQVWADMANIFWGAGLQVVADWYVSTETMNALKDGGYVQGTHNIVLKKRQGKRTGWSDEIVHEIRDEVKAQVEEMIGLNQGLKTRGRAENIFNDADMQMAGYAAALKVLTGYTEIDGKDMVKEAMRPRRKGESNIVDKLVEFAVGVANEQLVPEGLTRATWEVLAGPERYYLKLTEMSSRGSVKLDEFQNFAKAFRVQDSAALMASAKPNDASLFDSAGLGRKVLDDQHEFGGSTLRAVLYAIWQIRKEVDTDEVLLLLRDLTPDYFQKRELISQLAGFLAERHRFKNEAEASAARILRDAVLHEKFS